MSSYHEAWTLYSIYDQSSMLELIASFHSPAGLTVPSSLYALCHVVHVLEGFPVNSHTSMSCAAPTAPVEWRDDTRMEEV
eukprot:350311-Pleurochrysis_carterae.AAC.5